jgi:hypothetical protein
MCYVADAARLLNSLALAQCRRKMEPKDGWLVSHSFRRPVNKR